MIDVKILPFVSQRESVNSKGEKTKSLRARKDVLSQTDEDFLIRNQSRSKRFLGKGKFYEVAIFGKTLYDYCFCFIGTFGTKMC